MAAVDGTSSNQSTFGSVWDTKVRSTVKPSLATAMPGPSARPSGQVPYLRSARSQPATVPGTPADRPLQRASLNGSAAPFSQNESGCIVAGDSSRESIVVTLPLAVRITMNPPPPMPHEYGSVTPSTPAAATAASIAFPPRRNVRIAAWVPSRSTVAAAPPLPTAVGCFCSWASAICGSKRTIAIAATIRRRTRTIAAAVPGLPLHDASTWRVPAHELLHLVGRGAELRHQHQAVDAEPAVRVDAVGVDPALRAHAQFQLGDVPPGPCELAAEALDLLGGLIEVEEEAVPAVAAAGRTAVRGGAMAGDHHR